MTAKSKIEAEGYLAYYAGHQEDSNPYDKYLMEPHYELWLNGFYNAVDEDVRM